MMADRPFSNEFVATHFDAIMEICQLGERGSQALCKVLFVNVQGISQQITGR